MAVGKARNLPQRTSPETVFHVGRPQAYSQTVDKAENPCPRANTLA